MSATTRAPGRVLACLALCSALLLPACGGDAPKPAKRIDAPQEAVARVGDVTLRAHVLRTAHLDETVARGYGLRRDDRTLMLLVTVRQGPEGRDVALPATVHASVTDLHGQRRAIAMRELRTGDLVDHIGTVDVSPPDTLRFDLKIAREGAAVAEMTFNREITPE